MFRNKTRRSSGKPALMVDIVFTLAVLFVVSVVLVQYRYAGTEEKTATEDSSPKVDTFFAVADP